MTSLSVVAQNRASSQQLTVVDQTPGVLIGTVVSTLFFSFSSNNLFVIDCLSFIFSLLFGRRRKAFLLVWEREREYVTLCFFFVFLILFNPLSCINRWLAMFAFFFVKRGGELLPNKAFPPYSFYYIYLFFIIFIIVIYYYYFILLLIRFF